MEIKYYIKFFLVAAGRQTNLPTIRACWPVGVDAIFIVFMEFTFRVSGSSIMQLITVYVAHTHTAGLKALACLHQTQLAVHTAKH